MWTPHILKTSASGRCACRLPVVAATAYQLFEGEYNAEFLSDTGLFPDSFRIIANDIKGRPVVAMSANTPDILLDSRDRCFQTPVVSASSRSSRRSGVLRLPTQVWFLLRATGNRVFGPSEFCGPKQSSNHRSVILFPRILLSPPQRENTSNNYGFAGYSVPRYCVFPR